MSLAQLPFQSARSLQKTPPLKLLKREPLVELSLTKKTPLKVYSGFDCVDKSKIKALLEAKFAPGKLKENYFSDPAERVFVVGDYEAVAIMKTIAGVPYLDKIASSAKGAGQALMNELKSAYQDGFAWRTKNIPERPNSWYLKECTGHSIQGEWAIYWFNVPEKKLFSLVPAIANLPQSFQKQT
ncbi:MAG: hypothetical protein AABX38_08060 [Candidatus Micrarchaeota archaeon]